jgi:DNA-binding MarR family transcriptional regulator
VAKEDERVPTGGLRDPSRLGVLFRNATRLIRVRLREYGELYGLSYNQYLVLREVHDVPGTTQRQVSANVGIAEPTIVSTTVSLVELGLVARERSTTDRRQTHLHLTANGRKTAESILRGAIQIDRTATKGMTQTEIRTLRKLLVLVNANLESSPSTIEPRPARKRK